MKESRKARKSRMLPISTPSGAFSAAVLQRAFDEEMASIGLGDDSDSDNSVGINPYEKGEKLPSNEEVETRLRHLFEQFLKPLREECTSPQHDWIRKITDSAATGSTRTMLTSNTSGINPDGGTTIVGKQNSITATKQQTHRQPSTNATGDVLNGDDDDDEDSMYPRDAYTLVALNGPTGITSWPFRRFLFFAFGMTPIVFQLIFLTILFINVVDPVRGTLGENANPGAGNDDGLRGLVAGFTPSNAMYMVKLTQVVSLLTYVLFPRHSLMDVITAVRLYPYWAPTTTTSKNTEEGDDGVPVWCIRFSCILRFLQGMWANVVVLLVVIVSDNVLDIILNFTALNFLSELDDEAFDLARSGVFGQALKRETDAIATKRLPGCLRRNPASKHVWFLAVMAALCILTFVPMALVFDTQMNVSWWTTTILRMEFDKETPFGRFSGCYEIDVDSVYDKRYNYGHSHNHLHDSVPYTIGYCKDDRHWILYTGESTDPCDPALEDGIIAVSATTDDFDISATFDRRWVSSKGAPLEVYFFGTDESELYCDKFLGDGRCDAVFNTFGYDYDNGDCCASTCRGVQCGNGPLTSAFGVSDVHGDGYPDCQNPTMVPITIKLDNITQSFSYVNHQHSKDRQFYFELDDDNPQGDRDRDYYTSVIEPNLQLSCDDMYLLSLHVSDNMAGHMETILVEDAAICTIRIQNSTNTSLLDMRPIWYVDYTIYHGDEASVESDPIVIVRESSANREFTAFVQISECILSTVSPYVDNSTIYKNDRPQNQAMRWLQTTEEVSTSWCGDNNFIERYALTVLNFAAPIESQSNLGASLWQPTISPANFSAGTNSSNVTTMPRIISKPISSSADFSTVTNSSTVSTMPVVIPQPTTSSENLWINNRHQCSWRSVGCMGRSVETLELNGYYLRGTIATEIGLLTQLTTLQLGECA